MSITKSLYNALLRRTSTFTMTIVVSAFVFERSFDQGVDYFWRTHNKGKLWEDVKEKLDQSS
ncbi:cytochrome b-c1 complex subunit 9 [Homalodisca vitripennis]|uniref:cytochrome b-c1 complex subunit 9 n=1 Tax=Homalodisca vitripennis TaxID=197043 RepID=UPI001EEB0DE2|nr:cytochrome b-c1 complex subunit 9 [Homalodisca vitripennis]